jgi:hypothetical protein
LLQAGMVIFYLTEGFGQDFANVDCGVKLFVPAIEILIGKLFKHKHLSRKIG